VTSIPELSVVVPVHNEAAVLPELERRLAEVLPTCAASHEIVYVDDGSTDQSPILLLAAAERDPRVRIVSFTRNFGHQAAVTAGIAHARGRAVVVMDADLQDPPEVVPRLVAQWRAGFEVVSAVRETREGEDPVRLLLIKLFYRVLRGLSPIDLTPDVGDFRLIDRRVADALDRLPERNRYVRGLIRWLGFRHAEVRYRRAPRFAGSTKYSYGKLMRLAVDGITSFSTVPLRAVVVLGFVISALSVVLIAYALWGRLVAGETPAGWTSVFVTLTFLSGVQIVSIGIVGAYVSRIFDEVKARPLYVIRAAADREGPPAAPRAPSGDGTPEP
jgi:dolichol-phosphate mannosyltransferase